MTDLLRVENLTKRFAQVVANDHVTFTVAAGEIHCLFGENGAGKSTLSACIYGYHQPDGGRILYRGKEVRLTSPSDAIRLGIGMVHQHFVLVEEFTVLENIIVGTQESGVRLRDQEARKKIRDLCNAYEIDLNLDAYVWELAVGQQQWVEILKALYLGAELLILDEPTAVLTPQESDRLFRIIRQMCARHLSVILISHKLNEILQSDRVTVLRKGQVVGTMKTAETTPQALTTMMVGREVDLTIHKPERPPGQPVLEVKNVSAVGEWGEPVLEDVSFTVAEHEILGLAGVAGNGQKQLFEALMGLRPLADGEVSLKGERIARLTPREALDRGVGYIPDDRFRDGLVGDFSVAENLVLGWQYSPDYRKGPFLDGKRMRQLANEKIEQFQIATPSAESAAGTLSGGNAQRIILAREFLHANCLILANQPTRGLDVGVIEYVYETLLQKRDEGFAIVLASEELEDLFNLADRIAVFFKGRVMAILDPKATTVEQVGLLMAGHGDAREAART
ncbi:MAG: ABC transporter ATP-binding protein [Pseudomonadota bacterium]